MRIIWTTPARMHRDNIIRYIAEDNPYAALELDNEISNTIERIVAFPQSGRIGRVLGTREVIIRANYIIVYELIDVSVVILYVLHASQQYPPE